MKKICIFCGSKSGDRSDYVEAARELGKTMAEKGLGIVYGGASVGVMGELANASLEQKGEVIGVIPQSIIDLEVGHKGLTELYTVDSMHERKKKMYDLSDAFFALPGGFGTLDELCEILTWAQLKYHQKPCYLINQNGFFDNLMQHFKHINKEGFLSDEHLKLLHVFSSSEDALDHFLKS